MTGHLNKEISEAANFFGRLDVSDRASTVSQKLHFNPLFLDVFE